MLEMIAKQCKGCCSQCKLYMICELLRKEVGMTNYERVTNIRNLVKLMQSDDDLADKACFYKQSKSDGVCPHDVDGNGPEHLESCLECNREWFMAEESV